MCALKKELSLDSLLGCRIGPPKPRALQKRRKRSVDVQHLPLSHLIGCQTGCPHCDLMQLKFISCITSQVRSAEEQPSLDLRF